MATLLQSCPTVATPAETNGGATQAVTMTSLPANGSLITVPIGAWGTAPPGAVFSTTQVTDNKGNTFTLDKQSTTTATPGEGVAVFSFLVPANANYAGSYIVTATCAGSGVTMGVIVFKVQEWSPGSGTWVGFDVGASNTVNAAGTSGTSSATAAVNANAELAIGVISIDSTSTALAITKDAAYTELFVENNASNFTGAEGQYKTGAPLSGAQTATWTWGTSSPNYTAIVAVYKTSGAAAAYVPYRPPNMLIRR